MKKQTNGLPRVAHRTINVSELDLLDLCLVNAKGDELLSIDFDRIADEKPQIKVNAPGKNGNNHATFVLFDLVA